VDWISFDNCLFDKKVKYNLSEISEHKAALVKLNHLISKSVIVEIKEIRAKRTIKQNSYLHVILTIFANETGYTVEESKILFARLFGKFMIYEKNGHKFKQSTSSLDTMQLTEYIDFIRHYSSEEAGIYLPTPDEYLKNQISYDNQMR
jgi:hypothetical protein